MNSSSRINVLFIHANNHDIGGADNCLLKLTAALDRGRINPMVLLGKETDIVKKYKEQNIPIEILPMKRIRKSLDLFYLLEFAFNFCPTVLRIAKLIVKHKIDIVHSNDFLDIYGPIATSLTRAKSLQHCRFIMNNPKWIKTFLCAVVKKFNHRIIVVSDGVAKSMFNTTSSIQPKIVKCYDWLDMDLVGHTHGNDDFRSEIGIKRKNVLIGIIGRLEPWKGQHVFIKAAKCIAKSFPEARFLIVGGMVTGRGRENYTEKLKSLSSELQLSDKIHFFGHRNDISRILAGLDIFVHCSVEPDPLPGVIMEAMEMGKPVVGPRAGGVPEEIIEGKTGLLYSPGNYKELAKKVGTLIDFPKYAEKCGILGKQRAKAIFNKEILCQKMVNIYEEMMSE